MLPPGADAAQYTAPGQQVALPTEDGKEKTKGGNADFILIPDDEGRLVAVQEPKKTVRRGNTVVELKTLSPEEKQRRRLIRNIIVWSFCAIVLSIAMAVLMTIK